MKNKKMKTILITSGPVHEHLDDVKIITNKFKGGRIAALAKRIVNTDSYYDDATHIYRKPYKVVYLCSKFTSIPSAPSNLLEIVYHNGFNDYYEKVKKYSKEVDAVILGAAVCNLIPVEPIKGKFPSHNYKPNDVIPINFKIAPRVVDMVKEENPKVNLFAFKLLSGVKHEELIDAAYDIALESKATAVIANDLQELNTKHIVTKEKGVLKYKEENYHKFILECIENEYYSSIPTKLEINDNGRAINKCCDLYEKYKEFFQKTYGDEKYIFGTIAVIDRGTNIITTTTRGKRDFTEWTKVEVDHSSKHVYYDSKKATLNAPLLDHIFKQFPTSTAIVHYHDFQDDVSTLSYAIPGTEKDSIRDFSPDSKDYKGFLNDCRMGFNIEGHGTFEILYT